MKKNVALVLSGGGARGIAHIGVIEELEKQGFDIKSISGTMIILYIIDQFVWNRIIYNMGVGPRGMRINKITTKNLEPKIIELVSNNDFKMKAKQVSSQMGKENYREKIYKSIIE